MIRLIAILSVLTLFSSSSERKAQYHYKKALKHGLKVVNDSDTIRITTLDSFPVIKNDTIVWEKFIAYRDTVINFNRIEYKERVKTLRIEGKTKWKTAKASQVVKYRTSWWLVLIAFILGFVLRFILNSTFISRVRLFFRYFGQI